MIVSFARHFLFVAIPRTGTHALREMLRPELGPHDWEQCARFVEKRFPIGALADRGHGHLTCAEVRPHVPPFVWNDLFKFCVVRDPLDRLISSCSFLHEDAEEMARDPRAVIARVLQSDDRMAHVLFKPQSDFVTDDRGELAVDLIARHESLQSDIDAVFRRLGFPPAILARRNASRRPEQAACVDDKIRGLAHARYRRDFELFDYPFIATP